MPTRMPRCPRSSSGIGRSSGSATSSSSSARTTPTSPVRPSSRSMPVSPRTWARPVLLVVSAFERTPDDVAQLVEIATAELGPGARDDRRDRRQPLRSRAARRDPRPIVRVRPAHVGAARDPAAVGSARRRPDDRPRRRDALRRRGDAGPRGRAHAGVRDERRPRARAAARRTALHRRWRSSGGARRTRVGPCRRRLPLAGGHRAQRWIPTERPRGAARPRARRAPADHRHGPRLLRRGAHRGLHSRAPRPRHAAQDRHRAERVRGAHRARFPAAHPRRPAQRRGHTADVRIAAARTRPDPPSAHRVGRGRRRAHPARRIDAAVATGRRLDAARRRIAGPGAGRRARSRRRPRRCRRSEDVGPRSSRSPRSTPGCAPTRG